MAKEKIKQFKHDLYAQEELCKLEMYKLLEEGIFFWVIDDEFKKFLTKRWISTLQDFAVWFIFLSYASFCSFNWFILRFSASEDFCKEIMIEIWVIMIDFGESWTGSESKIEKRRIFISSSFLGGQELSVSGFRVSLMD